ncbi:MAG: SDR family oxidoreductase [candidate division KSB1 bacterium]|nr:SDR family oxidoreductase [candidate division KSB1 bacterium]
MQRGRMELKLNGQVALVTGAGGLIGAAVARALAQAGARTALTYFSNRAAVENLAAELREIGSKVVLVRADVTVEREVNEAVLRVEQEWGRVDILVNVVGHYLRKPLAETTAAEWQDLLQSNLTSAFLACKAALPGMRRRSHGRIINVGLAGLESGRGFAHIGAHAVAKSALLAFTRSLAKQEAPYGISVNLVSPGFVEDPTMSAAERQELANRIPAGRLASPEEVANAVLFLASSAAAYITGTNLEVAGGWGL